MADGSIEGKVTDQVGDPIAGAEVKVRVSGSGNDFGGVYDITDDQGNYTIEGLPPDDYDLRVEDVGYDPAERMNVTVESGLATREDFTLSPSERKVIGELTDPFGIATVARNTASSGASYALKAVNESNDYRSAAIRGQAKETCIEGVSQNGFGVVGDSDSETGVVGKTRTTGYDEGVLGSAQAGSGNATGVRGITESPDGNGVVARNNDSAGNDGYALLAAGQISVSSNVAYSGDFERHVAMIENTSRDSTGDILGLKTFVSDPPEQMNFISFVDPNGQVGQIDGNGSGGVNYKSATADIAEYFPKADPGVSFETGAVVGLRGGEVISDPTAGEVALVVSDAPMVTGNAPLDSEDDDQVCLALLGQVSVAVATPVEAGEWLAATEAGRAVPVDDAPPDAPRVALALANHESGVGTVRSLVGMPRIESDWYEDSTESDARVDDQVERIEALEAENEALRERVAKLERRIDGSEPARAATDDD